MPPDSKFAKHKTVDLRGSEGRKFHPSRKRLAAPWDLAMISAGERGIRPQAVFESNSPESVRNLIAAGLGIGFWPEKAWGGKPGHGVVLIPIRYPNCRRDLVVTVFEQAGNKPVVDEFVNYFCKYFEKDPSGMGDVTV
ncbi:MAG: LysR family transcriptional regulator substrate-binding protein [Roseburia sp.]